jgi:hypothetical protein
MMSQNWGRFCQSAMSCYCKLTIIYAGVQAVGPVAAASGALVRFIVARRVTVACLLIAPCVAAETSDRRYTANVKLAFDILLDAASFGFAGT